MTNISRSPKKTNNEKIKTLGPISDLESHLPSEWWRSLFNSLYLKTDGDVVENHDNTVSDIDYITKIANLNKDMAIFDLCCGQGRHSLELSRRGYNDVTGVDRSRYLVRLAKKRSTQENLPVIFREGDARKISSSKKQYDRVIMMGNSFGYFEHQEDDVSVLKSVSNCLKEDGFLVLDLVDGEWMKNNFEARSWEWIDEKYFVCRERQLSDDRTRIISREVITHSDKGVIADQFYAERLYNKDELIKLLEKLNYRDITYHSIVESGSSRNQDMGMMARRMFFTAKCPIKVVSQKVLVPVSKKVMVLMGDSTLPDKVKVNSKFNEEDFETINQMKIALKNIPGYKFSYFQDHKNLISEIAKNKPDFVFNLCDEGYNNDPFMELHITAYLEMLGIPYTGNSPACLGLCYNKSLVRAIAETLDIPTPLESYLDKNDGLATIPSTFPALLKPNCGDSSMGITKDAVVYNADQLMKQLNWLRKTYGDCAVLIQEYLTGPEYSVGIVGNIGLNYKTLPILEVDYSDLDADLPPILGYESKWIAGSPYWEKIKYKEAEISEDNRRLLYDYSNRLFNRLDCKDVVRFDFRTDCDGIIKLLEVNPNPGWCWDGKMNIMAKWDGLTYSDLLLLIIQSAEERYSQKK